MVENKTLADYITSGKHEFVAFVRDMMSLDTCSRSNCGTWGNDIGVVLFGILLCDKNSDKSESPNKERARIVYKSPGEYEGDSDIMFHDFRYEDAKVVSLVPVALEVSSFHSGYHLKKESGEFCEAREILKKYGMY